MLFNVDSKIICFVLLLVVEAPLTVACQYLLLPQLPVLNLAIRLLAIGAVGVALVGDHGAVGVGVAQVIGSAVSLIVLAVLLTVTVKRRLARSKGG